MILFPGLRRTRERRSAFWFRAPPGGRAEPRRWAGRLRRTVTGLGRGCPLWYRAAPAAAAGRVPDGRRRRFAPPRPRHVTRPEGDRRPLVTWRRGGAVAWGREPGAAAGRGQAVCAAAASGECGAGRRRSRPAAARPGYSPPRRVGGLPSSPSIAGQTEPVRGSCPGCRCPAPVGPLSRRPGLAGGGGCGPAGAAGRGLARRFPRRRLRYVSPQRRGGDTTPVAPLPEAPRGSGSSLSDQARKRLLRVSPAAPGGPRGGLSLRRGEGGR